MFQADQVRYRRRQIIEEKITEEKKSPPCESCVKDGPPELLRRFEPERWFVEHVAVFLCFDCEMYVCVNCLPGHESHEGMRVGRKESEGEEREISESERMEEEGSSEIMKNKGKGLGKKKKRMRLEEEGKEEGEKNEGDRMEEQKEREQRESERMEDESERKLTFMLDDLMRESETERVEKFERSHVSIYDRVYVKHELDQEDCFITGLCVLENQRWVVCDRGNDCIKIFTLGSNVLQRYIRFVGPGMSRPRDVTEILVNQNSSEPNLASGSSSGVSVTDRAKQDKQCLIAVALSAKILFIDLSKKPAFIHKAIHTRRTCYSIQFYEDKIFTTCRGDLDSPWSVYIYPTNRDTLNKFNTGIYDYYHGPRLAVFTNRDALVIDKFNTGIYDYYHGPHLAVVSGRVYLTDKRNNKVQCRNFDGQVLSEITIEGSLPTGFNVGPDNNVYICTRFHDKVYKLNADLTWYKSVLDQTAGCLKEPNALCYYRDKLFISHVGSPSLDDIVTVVRLL